jgi:hypothetical protein
VNDVAKREFKVIATLGRTPPGKVRFLSHSGEVLERAKKGSKKRSTKRAAKRGGKRTAKRTAKRGTKRTAKRGTKRTAKRGGKRR